MEAARKETHISSLNDTDSLTAIETADNVDLAPEFKIQIDEIQRETEVLKAEIVDIKNKIQFYQKRVENTPKREQELLSLKRDYQNIQQNFESLLARTGISIQDIYTIFFNHKLLAARSRMARWIGHQQVRSDPFDWDLNVAVKAGDRIGLFGRDMAALVI